MRETREMVEHINGWEVTHILPVYTPEERLKVDELVLEKLYSIFFHDDK